MSFDRNSNAHTIAQSSIKLVKKSNCAIEKWHFKIYMVCRAFGYVFSLGRYIQTLKIYPNFYPREKNPRPIIAQNIQ